MKSIFERFDEEALNPEDVLVWGVDNGDGELVVANASLSKGGGDIILQPLALSEDSLTTDFAVWSEEIAVSEIKGELGRAIASKIGNTENSIVYTSYKRIPGTDAEEHYFSGDVLKRRKRNPSYMELMSKAFGKLIEVAILKYSDTDIEHKKDIYLFVGRPSSSKWQGSEKEYKKYLTANLPDIDNENYKGTGEKRHHFHVIVISEAIAAMANEYRESPELGMGTVAIIDGGSSTFDCVVVEKGHVICEYSRQIGANMLDKNMLDLILFGKNNDKPYLGWKQREQNRERKYAERNEKNELKMQRNMGGDLIKVRMEKESYYGPDGTGGELDATIKLYEKGERDKTLKKSEDVIDIIDIAIKKMPVDVRPSYGLEENDPYGGSQYTSYPSFEKGLEAFFKGAKAKWEKYGVKQPDQIIVTGGATLMPFVNEMMYTIFEVNKRKIKVTTQEDKKQIRRSYSVAYGTAYMGYVELYKQQIYREIKEKCEKILDDVKSGLQTAIVESYTEEAWKGLCDVTKKWLDNSTCLTIKDWEKIPLQTNWENQLPTDIEQFLNESRWELTNHMSVIAMLNQILKEKTKAIFKNACDYSYHITGTQMTAVNSYAPVLSFSLTLFMGGIVSRFINGFSASDTSRIYNYSQKKIMYDNFTSKNAVAVKLVIRQQVEKSLQNIKEDIYKEIIGNLDDSIQQYVEGLTSYFLMEDFNAG